MNTQVYTIAEWVEAFPEPWKSQAKNQDEKINWHRKASSFQGAVSQMFIWEDSKQGHEYWQGFSLRTDVTIDTSNTIYKPFDPLRAMAGDPVGVKYFDNIKILRVLCVDKKEPYSVVVIEQQEEDGEEVLDAYNPDGLYMIEQPKYVWFLCAIDERGDYYTSSVYHVEKYALEMYDNWKSKYFNDIQIHKVKIN